MFMFFFFFLFLFLFYKCGVLIRDKDVFIDIKITHILCMCNMFTACCNLGELHFKHIWKYSKCAVRLDAKIAQNHTCMLIVFISTCFEWSTWRTGSLPDTITRDIHIGVFVDRTHVNSCHQLDWLKTWQLEIPGATRSKNLFLFL